jgi:hypothetical protein
MCGSSDSNALKKYRRACIQHPTSVEIFRIAFTLSLYTRGREIHNPREGCYSDRPHDQSNHFSYSHNGGSSLISLYGAFGARTTTSFELAG